MSNHHQSITFDVLWRVVLFLASPAYRIVLRPPAADGGHALQAITGKNTSRGYKNINLLQRP